MLKVIKCSNVCALFVFLALLMYKNSFFTKTILPLHRMVD